jgi:hypothetical protein
VLLIIYVVFSMTYYVGESVSLVPNSHLLRTISRYVVF